MEDIRYITDYYKILSWVEKWYEYTDLHICVESAIWSDDLSKGPWTSLLEWLAEDLKEVSAATKI